MPVFDSFSAFLKAVSKVSRGLRLKRSTHEEFRKFVHSLYLSKMGNRSSLLLRDEEIAQIQEETGCAYRLSLILINTCVKSKRPVMPFIFLCFSFFLSLLNGEKLLVLTGLNCSNPRI